MDSAQKFEILKTELNLIQATLDKYDDLIFRGRNLFVTLWLAAIGLGFTIRSEFVPLLAAFLAFVYWLLEGTMRHQYWYKYVDRYRFLRDSINRNQFNLTEVSVYDLTNHYHRVQPGRAAKICACFLKVEPTCLYATMLVGAVVIAWLLHAGILGFPAAR